MVYYKLFVQWMMISQKRSLHQICYFCHIFVSPKACITECLKLTTLLKNHHHQISSSFQVPQNAVWRVMWNVSCGSPYLSPFYYLRHVNLASLLWVDTKCFWQHYDIDRLWREIMGQTSQSRHMKYLEYWCLWTVYLCSFLFNITPCQLTLFSVIPQLGQETNPFQSPKIVLVFLSTLLWIPSPVSFYIHK